MKQLFAPTFLLFAACFNGKNESMTHLVNSKKITEDSIETYSFLESKWLQQAKDEMHSSHDSLKWKPMADSSAYYFGKGHTAKEKLNGIEFSIDSLSKMK
jgi:hypothetical protein